GSATAAFAERGPPRQGATGSDRRGLRELADPRSRILRRPSRSRPPLGGPSAAPSTCPPVLLAPHASKSCAWAKTAVGSSGLASKDQREWDDWYNDWNGAVPQTPW